ncbi:MAG TPA: GPP34 family phosphoprotein [Longimicrobium sp.]|jgi:hypothetical protein|uniref:GPP34 family phosphoprotein n=1 Tax=Longimicrobium sp. TaxID=2029185 RepID=UPI002EDA4F00
MSGTGQALTPTEAQVLLEPNSIPPQKALRTALMHLAGAGHLRLLDGPPRPWWWGGSRKRVRRAARNSPLPGHLSAVMAALFPPSKPDEPLSPEEMTTRLQAAFGYSYGQFLSGHVLPELVSRGLLEVEEYRLLRLFPQRRYRHTAQGEAARAWVQGALQPARHLPELLRRDPAGAAAASARLGGLVLIADELRPHLADLAAAARGNPTMPEMITMLDGVAEDERRIAWLDAVEILGEVDWGGVLEAVDGVGSAFDSADAGGSDGGGDGDGGGGE